MEKGPRFVFVLGPPGSGKSSICKTVVKLTHHPLYRFLHLSVGDYLRELSDPSKTEPSGPEDINCDKIREYLKENKLLPAEDLIPALKHRIESTPNWNSEKAFWLIDGFPRDMESLRSFEENVGKPCRVLVLQCSRNVARDRFLGRAREEADDEKRFDKRFDEYLENMKEIRKHYNSIEHVVSLFCLLFSLFCGRSLWIHFCANFKCVRLVPTDRVTIARTDSW
ncbi:P-loop containing nucleoside triphosphate hydrolase protein [Xylaria sp. CBS 124048]|nr:P-loop containing nucleoside triphosphate hydrolase protein [Xylaria sp. CBS 124048]